MGSVYEARNTSTLKRCALKLLSSPELEQHPEIVQRFLLEARAASVLESEHIVQVFDAGIDNQTGRPYIIMEFLRGDDLKTTIERHGALEPWIAAKIALQAATGLAKAHELGVFHRDIKPANLFLTRRDSGDVCVKLLDFGIAKVKAETGLITAGTLTRTGGLLGTPLYMSPEQIRRPASVDARCDVWSLGIVLYECLSGDVPFPNSGSVGELMAEVLTAELPLLQDLSPWVPSDLAAIVHQALSRDVSRRYANAGAMRDALGQSLSGKSNFHESELMGVSSADKTRISPRLVLLHDHEMRGTTNSAPTRHDPPRGRPVGHEPTWVSSSNPAPRSAATTTAREHRRTTRAMFGALAILATLGLGAAALTRNPSAKRAEAPATSASLHAATTKPLLLPPAPPVTTSPPAIASNARQLWLRVPPQTSVRVNGSNAKVEDGRVAIHGAIGETPLVELVRGKLKFEARIAITDSGLLPDRLELSPGSLAHSSSKPTSAVTNDPASTPIKPTPSASATRPSPKLVESTSEF